jgi:hypothetical protein
MKRVFLTAPGIKSNRTRNADEIQKTIAHTLGVTDYSTKNGTVASSTNMSRLTPEQQKNKKALEDYERTYAAKAQWDGTLKFKDGKPVPKGPTTVELPTSGNDANGKPQFNRAAMPMAMPGTSGNNIPVLPKPGRVTRYMNRKGDALGNAE